MIAAIARAMPTGSNRNTVFFQTDHGGGFCGRWRKMNTPAATRSPIGRSPSNALRKRVTDQGFKDGTQSIHHQPNEAHQYRPLFFFGSTLKATMLVPPIDTPAPPTLAMAPADKEGRAIRCDATNLIAELEDHCRNKEPVITYQDH